MTLSRDGALSIELHQLCRNYKADQRCKRLRSGPSGFSEARSGYIVTSFMTEKNHADILGKPSHDLWRRFHPCHRASTQPVRGNGNAQSDVWGQAHVGLRIARGLTAVFPHSHASQGGTRKWLRKAVCHYHQRLRGNSDDKSSVWKAAYIRRRLPRLFAGSR